MGTKNKTGKNRKVVPTLEQLTVDVEKIRSSWYESSSATSNVKLSSSSPSSKLYSKASEMRQMLRRLHATISVVEIHAREVIAAENALRVSVDKFERVFVDTLARAANHRRRKWTCFLPFSFRSTRKEGKHELALSNAFVDMKLQAEALETTVENTTATINATLTNTEKTTKVSFKLSFSNEVAFFLHKVDAYRRARRLESQYLAFLFNSNGLSHESERFDGRMCAEVVDDDDASSVSTSMSDDDEDDDGTCVTLEDKTNDFLTSLAGCVSTILKDHGII